MGIDRRDFLKLAAAAGFVVAGPTALPRTARADGPYPGPYWVTIHAGGGWDPTLLCDPKGRSGEDDPEPLNRYDRSDIETVGPFSFAPVEGHRAFFERFRDQLLVINGIDTGTNSHDTGTRHVWSGGFDANMPSIAALMAATQGQTPALGFLTFGGYDHTDALVAPTRIPTVSAINEIAFPHRMDANEPESLALRPADYDRIAAARAARLERLGGHASLPREQRSMSVLFEARGADNELARLTDALPSELDDSNNPLRRQAELACASFASGLTVSANLTVGGFDTHGDHDNRHTPRLQQVLEGAAEGGHGRARRWGDRCETCRRRPACPSALWPRYRRTVVAVGVQHCRRRAGPGSSSLRRAHAAERRSRRREVNDAPQRPNCVSSSALSSLRPTDDF